MGEKVDNVMSERLFRLILGLSLMGILYCEWIFPNIGVVTFPNIAGWQLPDIGAWRLVECLYLGMLLFEGITNLRIPIIVSRIRYGSEYLHHLEESNLSAKFGFEAERMLRLVVVLFVVIGLQWDEFLWWLPWFVGFMLMLAGITSICPMVMFFRWIGLR